MSGPADDSRVEDERFPMTAPDHEQAERQMEARQVAALFAEQYTETERAGILARAYLALAAQLAEREREIEAQREVLHQIVGFSRTVPGDHPTVHPACPRCSQEERDAAQLAEAQDRLEILAHLNNADAFVDAVRANRTYRAQLAEAQKELEGLRASEAEWQERGDRAIRAEAQLAERERELEWAHSRIAELTAREAEEGGRKDG